MVTRLKIDYKSCDNTPCSALLESPDNTAVTIMEDEYTKDSTEDQENEASLGLAKSPCKSLSLHVDAGG